MRLGGYCAQLLAELATVRSDIWVLDGDLADSTGAEEFATRHPDRFVMGGIAEQSLISIAAGMAACGQRPWVFSFACFLCYRAYDQIRVCLSQARQPVTLVGSHSGGCAARNGKTHAAVHDLALMTVLPNIRVWSPAGPNEVRAAVDDILAHEEAAYLRLPRRPSDDVTGPAGAPLRWMGHSTEVAIAATGVTSHLAVAAQGRLAAVGIEIGVLHCPRLTPVSREDLNDALNGCSHVVTVEDHAVRGGLGSLIRDVWGAGQVTALGWPSDWSGESGADDDLLAKAGLTVEAVCAAVIAAGRSARTN